MIVIEADEVRAYVERRLGVVITQPHRVLGFMRDDKRPLCAIVVSDFNHSNVELTIVAEPGGINRAVIRYLARYLFAQLGCRRVTLRTKKRNTHAAAMARRFGFTFEVCIKQFFPDDDALLFRLFKNDCRWLAQGVDA